VLRSLADERSPLPGAEDELALRTPHWTLRARRVPDTNLVITYMITEDAVEVTAVHPLWSEHR
jgi:hypothetical protein